MSEVYIDKSTGENVKIINEDTNFYTLDNSVRIKKEIFTKKYEQKVEIDLTTLQPDELNELRKTIKEYVSRKQNIHNEQETLKEDEKTLDEEYAEKLDVRTMKLVEAHFKLQARVQHKETFDLFVETLKDETL
jgi:hypothetical protein